MKKLLSFLLTVVMVFPMMTAVVNADEQIGHEEDDVSDLAYQFGGGYDVDEDWILDVDDNLDLAVENVSGAKDAIATAIINGQTSVSISAYNIPRANVRNVYAAVLNEHPEFFYMKRSIDFYYSTNTGCGTSITLQRTISASECNKVEQKINEIMTLIDSSMSDMQKALVVHDYIVENTAYAYDDYLAGITADTPHEHDAYGCLVDNLCVCEGYALAYSLVMRRIGIPCEYVSSSEMHHGWNVIYIGGYWYHVDCTYDDPVRNVQGRVNHDHFLKSDSEMLYNLDHSGWSTSHTCTRTTYDSTWWDDIDSMIYVYGGKYYYLTEGSDYYYYNLVERNGSNVTTLKSNLACRYVSGSSTYRTSLYMSAAGGKLYYHTYGQIIEYVINTGAETVVYEQSGDAIRELAVLTSGIARIRFRSMSADSFTTVRIFPDPTATGWQQLSGNWYYVNSNGTQAIGWASISGKWYYFNSQGVMKTGWQQISGSWYYLGNDGAMKTGWQFINNEWYYFGSNGKMKTDWQIIDNQWYYFDNSGHMARGWAAIDGSWFYFKSNGIMLTGWQKLDGEWYYFGSSGKMKTGWQQIDGEWYYFGSSGKMKTGWQQLDGKWYYFGSSGKMKTGWQFINNKWYCFSSSGKLYVNTYVDGYYVNANGVMVK